MPSQYKRLLAPTTLTASMEQPHDMIFDAGGFETLNVEFRVLKAGSEGDVQLQHAATSEEPNSWINLGSPVDVAAAGNTYAHISSFLRFLRWVATSDVAGSPVVQIDIVAKGGG